MIIITDYSSFTFFLTFIGEMAKRPIAMEKKQLIFIPPMSTPLQNLNEVLQSVAEDENIEISIIDDLKELTQFMGSSGQSLIAFSNAKKCVTFLQENRFIVAKTHSKVILLTPKEIPAKTLVKFVKLGLTESILENSPPKTLLYKVKLLLRSIKSSSKQEERDQVVKNMFDSMPNSVKPELNADKTEHDETKPKDQGEELSKFKTEQAINNIIYDENLKLNITTPEDALETHWKSGRIKTDTSSPDEPAAHKIDDGESSPMDMYYRKKKGATSFDSLTTEEEDFYQKNNLLSLPERQELDQEKRNLQLALESDAKDKKTREINQENGPELFPRAPGKNLILEAADNQDLAEKALAEKEKAQKDKKRLEQLALLSAEAKRRQTTAQEKNVDGHITDKMQKAIDDQDEGLEVEKKEYDNSELHKKKKSFDLDLASSTEGNKGPLNNKEQKEQNNHANQADRINGHMIGKNHPNDQLNSSLMGDLNTDQPNKMQSGDRFDLDLKKTNAPEENFKDKKGNLNLFENPRPKGASGKKMDIGSLDQNERDKARELNLEPGIVDKTRKKSEGVVAGDIDKDQGNSPSLQLVNNDDTKKSKDGDNEAPLTLENLNKTSLAMDKKEKEIHLGKVDKINTYHRGIENNQGEHSWDDLHKKDSHLSLSSEKSKRKEEEMTLPEASKVNGEITIDYRLLKEEFNQLSQSRQSSSEESMHQLSSPKLLDAEDEGSFKVIEVDARGFDFGINIIGLIEQKESKAQDFYKTVAEELIRRYQAFPVFYTFKPSEKKHIEVFDSFIHFEGSLVSDELKEWWTSLKSQDEFSDFYFNKTMATWLCREIESKSGNAAHWEDVELPQWADNELTTKKVEFIFPYFDGLDRMGLALVFFPSGLTSKTEKGLTITLEMIRTILLDGLQRETIINGDTSNGDVPPENKNIITMLTGFFNRHKAG